SYTCAASGSVLLPRMHMNQLIQQLAAVLVIAAGITLLIARGEWAMLAFAIGIVWIAEAANTALEFLADRVSRAHDEPIRRAKDIAAGAVLLAAITAGVIGVLILGPHAWALLRGA